MLICKVTPILGYTVCLLQVTPALRVNGLPIASGTVAIGYIIELYSTGGLVLWLHGVLIASGTGLGYIVCLLSVTPG